ncbi:ABC transporter substrate-binding protein [Chloroflexi bacterium TSY]|nr:ABC transporter substrate-binding protein [Chloroflexi bacterium TSY]
MKRVNFLAICCLLFSLVLAACGGAAPAPVVSDDADTSESAADASESSDADSDDESMASDESEEHEPYVNHLFATIADYEAATGNTIDSFGESPILAALVESGDLPAVEERLPVDVGVLRPRDEIGTYSGPINLIGFFEGAGAYSQFTENSQMGLLVNDPAYTGFFPNAAKAVEQAEDGMSITIYLREGLKWSDGDGLTSEDVVFWYELLQDEDLNPNIREDWKPGGELMGLNVIDDYTVEFTFSIPYHRATEVFAGSRPFSPAHFLKQYMPEYSDGAEALAEEEGYESWQQALQFHAGLNDDYYDRDPLAPTINPWVIADIGADSVLWERNPYYWRVDTVGNQLPYADSLLVIMTENVKTTGPVKSMAGELDINESGLTISDFPVLKRNEADGNYTVHTWLNAASSNAMALMPNYTVANEELREIFNDLRFRQALSLAINRAEISENIFLGLTKPFTGPTSPVWPGYEEWMGTHFADYDLERANALLDEMGLEWDEAQGTRLTPGGEPLSFIFEWETEWLAYTEDLLDLVKLYWKEIGVDIEHKFVPEDTLQTRFVANEIEMTNTSGAGGTEAVARSRYPIRLMPPWHWGGTGCCPGSAYPWRVWLDTEGVEGIEPPEDVKRIYELVEQWLDTPYGTDDYVSIANEIQRLNVENLYFIGTVSAPPRVFITSNRLRNAPGADGVWGARVMTPYLAEQYFVVE